jgi:alkylation response protein AidB-like acyl-CoA dehydrogenase
MSVKIVTAVVPLWERTAPLRARVEWLAPRLGNPECRITQGEASAVTNQTLSDLLGAVERIGPLIAEHAAAAEADRQLSGAVYQAMYDAGLFAMLAPKAYGGLELHPADCIQVWEAVVRIDAAAA